MVVAVLAVGEIEEVDMVADVMMVVREGTMTETETKVQLPPIVVGVETSRLNDPYRPTK